MFSFSSKSLWVAVVALVLCLGYAPSVWAVTLGSFGGRPADGAVGAKENPEWFVYTLQSGQSIDDTIEVINNTNEAITARLYPVDSTQSTDGTFAVEQETESRDQVGAWVHLSQSEVIVPPLSSVQVPFTITIPENATESAGEYTGGIMIEDAAQKPSDLGGISLTTRAGVRVYVTIPGVVVRDLRIEQFSLLPLSGNPDVLDVKMSIHNDGNTVQDITIVTAVDTAYSWPRWLTRKKLPQHTEVHVQVLPGQTLIRHQTLSRLWLGPLSAQAYVVYTGATGEATLTTQPSTYFSFPAWYFGVVLCVYLSFWFFLFARWIYRRSRARRKA